jgi:hypothetical protein
MSVATPHVNGYLPTMSNSAKLNLIQQQQKQQSPIHSPRHQQQMPSTPSHTANTITSPNMQRMIIHQQQQQQQHHIMQSPGPVSLPISINTVGKQLVNTNPNSNYTNLDQQHQLMAALSNQSRSRKPFNFPNDYADIKQHNNNNQQQQSPLNNEITHSQHNKSNTNYANMRSPVNQDENSFDDLDSVEVINLNQHKLVRSRHSLPDLNLPAEQQQPVNNKKNSRSNPKNSSGYYYYNENNNTNQMDGDNNEEEEENQSYDDPSREKYSSQQNLNMQPTSILKRYDSSEKMYPISRPGNNNNINTNPYSFQMNDPNNTNSYGRSHRNSKLI